ncbi:MAG: NADH peroxidase, partial [Mogibacterium sp.]|nr:NADH peroxidase [Mogibacterium sp.]
MAKWVCSVCGYVHEGDTPPEKCPQCGVPAEKFKKQDEDAAMTWASEHVVGVAQGVDQEIFDFLKAEFMG